MQGGQTVAKLVIDALARDPGHAAFAYDGTVVTCRQVTDMLGAMQCVMVKLGLEPGGAVATLTANRWESWCATIAAQGLGLRNTALHPLGSLADHLAQIDDAEIDFLIVDAAGHAARGAQLAARAPRLKAVMTVDAADYGLDLLAAAAAIGSATPRDLAAPDGIFGLVYTGGTTGKSKGVLYRQATFLASIATVLADFELPPQPRYLAVAPLSHVSGSKVVPTLLRGGTIHLLKSFDPERVLYTIGRERISVTLLVPTMIYVLLDHPGLATADLSSLELLLYGASPMSPTRLMEGLERIGPVFSQLYGQSECYPIMVQRKADHALTRPELFAACGKPVSNAQVRLLDDEDRDVAPGEAGEICIRSPLVMGGYWKQSELTAETLKGGWLHTGDVARCDDEGFYYIVDRKKDLVVSGGFNIFPREVEDVLTSHAAVATAAVIGIPDPRWGEAVTALVILRAGAAVSEQELIGLVKDRKGAICAPKSVAFVDELPMTPVGKVNKKALRARYWTNQGRLVG